MKALSNTARYARALVMAVVTVLPLLIITMTAKAETDRDVEFSQSELDQMLAPIALYPDTILSQVLIASTYPIEVVQADRWARNNKGVKGEEAVKLVDGKDWDPSVKALVAFPDILQRMSDDIDWTQRLGDAFLADESRVMDSVQSLRKKAYSSGSLNKVEHLKVERDDDEIVIEPAEERVVYVPVYDTRVVYGNWWWPDYPPVYWHYPASYVYVSGFYWGPSIYVGPTYFYSSPRWRERRIVVIDYHNHYPGQPHFYTSRSIVTFQGARDWHHDPIHRRGVAYYNDNLREHYGSRHESYRDDRVYRDHYRDNTNPGRIEHRDDHPQIHNDDHHPGNPRIIQSPNGDNNSHNREPFDRAEQLRVRMNNQANHNDGERSNLSGNRANTPSQPAASGNDPRQQIDRNFSRTPEPRASDQRVQEPRTSEHGNGNQGAASNVTNDVRERMVRSEAFNRARENNEASRGQQNSQPSPADRQPRTAPGDAATNRTMRIDNSMNRRVEGREEQRAPRSDGDNNQRVFRGRNNDDNKN